MNSTDLVAILQQIFAVLVTILKLIFSDLVAILQLIFAVLVTILQWILLILLQFCNEFYRSCCNFVLLRSVRGRYWVRERDITVHLTFIHWYLGANTHLSGLEQWEMSQRKKFYKWLQIVVNVSFYCPL